MSVRRLAEPAVQPASFAFSKAMSAEAKTWIRKYPEGRQQSAVIPLLMLAQEQEGWVTKAAIEHVADMLRMPYIRVLEVATFYTQFQLKPVGTRAHVQVCGTTPCMLRGSEALMDVCRSKIHHEQFHTNASGTLSWEEVECLGACVNAPMVMVFKDTYEDLTPESLAAIIDAFEAGGTPKPGPQVDRVFAAPQSGLTSLQDEPAVLPAPRDREATAAAGAASAADGAPTQAAKPKTDAPETDPRLKSPSKVKAAPGSEQAQSVAPKIDERAANRAEPAVEDAVKQRKRKSAAADAEAPVEAPENLKGAPIGPAGKRQAGEKAAPAGVPSPEAPRSARGRKPGAPKTDGSK